ncbi:ATPase family AAA domain-containing protein 5b isoform X2 [Pungitius pungitius]|uniref:ATPase family AAA domain-containing protein 5b isoform X2 n=1 Tax=Pungitius pungitius TaxID=134920 RepID=UPI002E11E403
MQNKLRRSKKSEHVACPSEVRASSCWDDGTSPGKDSASPPAGKKTPKGVKIAPIFLLKTQHGETKRSSEATPDRPVERQQEPVQLPRTQKVRSETERNISCRGQLSTSALHICLEEIQTSNPAFPVGTVFSTLQRKAGEKLQDFGTTANKSSPQNDLQEKRKRGNDGLGREPKRLRSSPSAEEPFWVAPCHSAPETSVTSNKLSRAHRLRRGGDPAGREPCSGFVNQPASRSQSRKTSGLPQRDSSLDDVLWTDKYSPLHSSEVIGNSASVDKLQIWLKKWKLRADSDERSKMGERKREENSDHSWDCGDFQGEVGPEDDDGREAPPCSTVLITGPAGVGKTASVYACAQELGFKVFEVNCSSQRSGRHLLAQLKEATQSHLVEISGKDPLAPTYFNNYAINGCTTKSETLPGKTVRPNIAASTSRNRAAKKSGRSGRSGKTSAPAATLADHFKKKARADRAHFGGPLASEKTDGEKSDDPQPGRGRTVPKNRKTATSLILFEEVDVVFDDDVGFLAAIKTFMTTTKRPVVLTTSDPLFRERFKCSLEEMVFKTPSAVNVCSYLRLVALAEGARLESDDAGGLVGLFGGDVRRCLLQLQLWVLGAGASPEEPSRERYPSVTGRGDDEADPGSCTASSLGLHRVTQRYLSDLLMRQFWAETDMKELLGLLAESWRGGVPLLYSNLELLLPIQAGGQNPSRRGKRKCVPAACDAASAQRAASSASLPKEAAGPGGETQASAAKAATGRLEALADFFDLMSYLDSTTAGPRRPEAFVWTGAEMKDGSLDEMSEDHEAGGACGRERLLEIRAAVEGLGCHRCCWRMSEASTEAPNTRQEAGDARRGRSTDAPLSPASSERPSLTFSAAAPCAPSVCRRRYGLSRKILSSASFGLLGSRRAVAVDYAPVLRRVCRLQRARERKEPSRCLRYLGSTQLGLSGSTIQLLAEDFSSTT